MRIKSVPGAIVGTAATLNLHDELHQTRIGHSLSALQNNISQ